MPTGMLGTVQLAAQSSFGTSNVVSLRGFPVISETLKEGVAQLQETQMYGRYGDSPRYSGMRQAGGQLNFEPKPTQLMMALWALCGQDAVTFTGSIASHKYRPLNTTDWDLNAAPLQPFSALVSRGVGCSMLYSDLVADQLHLSMKAGQLLKGDVTFVGGNYADAANVAATFPAADPPFLWNQSSHSYGGVALLNVKEFDLTQKNNLQPEWTQEVNSGQPTRVVRKGFVNVDGKITLLYRSNSLMADFLSQSEKQLLLNWQNGSMAFTVDVPNLRWTEWDPAMAGPGLIEVKAAFVADFEQVNSNYQVQYTVVNTQAAFP